MPNALGVAGGSPYQVQYNDQEGLSGIPNGTAGQVMTSNGASAAPSFQNLPLPDAVTAAVASGAIAIAPGTVTLGSTGALPMTLATPTAGAAPGHDGIRIWVVAITAHAHTVTTAANKINGNKDTVTFAAVGDCVELEAIGGMWYVRSLVGATLSEV